MKKVFIVALALIAIQTNAQEQIKKHREGDRKERMQRMSDLTPEEAATLRTKKMTLHLDLTDAQQKKIYKLNLEQAHAKKQKVETRKEKKEKGNLEKPTKEEYYDSLNDRLDQQIAMKKRIKEVLNDEQYKKWEDMQQKQKERKNHLRNKKMEHKKRK